MSRASRLISGLLFVPAALLAQTPSWHVATRFAAAGEGGWDYPQTDTTNHRLYLSRSTHVMVLDLDNGTVVGDVPNTPGVHGIAIAPELNRGFISNGRDSSVTIFDLRTLAVLSTVKVGGRNPDAIGYDAWSRRVFAMNGGSGTATAIDAATGTVAGMVTFGGKPEFVRSDERGTMYANVEDSSQIVAWDARTLAVKGKWSLAPCEEPTGLAIDRAGHRLFSACGNGLMAVVNADNGRLITTVPICRGTDGAAFDPASRMVFASCGDGTLSLVHQDGPDDYAAAGTVTTQRGARTITIDERTQRIFLPAAEYGPTPEATAAQPRPRAPMIPGSFTVVVVQP
jgi:DNA-binding beta-propeller fold protein YncE